MSKEKDVVWVCKVCSFETKQPPQITGVSHTCRYLKPKALVRKDTK